jgi:hypothetical protein
MDPLIKHLLLALLLLSLLLSACAPASELPFVVTVTTDSQAAPLPQNTPTPVDVIEQPVLPAPEASATLPASPTQTAIVLPTLTQTPNTTATPVVPTPTETLLPVLDLPTERSNPPQRQAWTGLPTYPGDSDPGLLFRVDYDPDVWAQTQGNYGDIVLGNRHIEYCTITPWTGRGLPGELKVTHEFRYIGSAAFDVNTVTDQGLVKFVSYVGGDQRILTGFQVSFNQQQDLCLLEAEEIFGTLRSFAAVPTVTPTP